MSTNIYCNRLPIMREWCSFGDTIICELTAWFYDQGIDEDFGWPLRWLKREHINKLKEAFIDDELLEVLGKVSWHKNYVPVVHLSEATISGDFPDKYLKVGSVSGISSYYIEICYAVKLLVDFSENHPEMDMFYFYYEETTFSPEEILHEYDYSKEINYG